MGRIDYRIKALLLVCLHLMLVSCGKFGSGAVVGKAPHPPKEVHAEVVDEGVKITWNPVTGADKYTVFWGFVRGEYLGLVNTEGHALILAGLNKGELYYLAVTAWNKSGESTFSSEEAVVYDDDPANAPMYFSRGQELLRAGADLQARAYLTAAIRLDPQNPDAYRCRALLDEKGSRAEQAREDLLKAEALYKKKALTRDRSRG